MIIEFTNGNFSVILEVQFQLIPECLGIKEYLLNNIDEILEQNLAYISTLGHYEIQHKLKYLTDFIL